MLEFLLDAFFTLLAIRAVWKLLRGVSAGFSARPAAPPPPEANTGPAPSVHMERDPVCGTFVIPDRAVSMSVGRHHVYFCSTACRDKYRPSTGSGRPEASEGRARTA